MVDKKNPQNSKPASRVPCRPGPFTSFNLVLGVLVYSSLPVLASWAAIHAHRVTIDGWKIIAAEVVVLQGALWFATIRCGSKEFPFWQGVALVAGYMRTGWMWTDMLAGGLGVFCVLIISGYVALTRKPRTLYYRLLHAFYRNRLVQ